MLVCQLLVMKYFTLCAIFGAALHLCPVDVICIDLLPDSTPVNLMVPHNFPGMK